MLNIQTLEKAPQEVKERFIEALDEEILSAIPYMWKFWARDNQIGPENPDANIWFIMTGRGWGKTRTAAEYIRDLVMNEGYRRPAIVGRNAPDVRDIMVEGPSGLMNISPPGEVFYEPSKKKIYWNNGAIGAIYYGSEPRSLRGPEHDCAWCDEIAYWQYVKETFMNLEMGLRIGQKPMIVVSCTPRPIKFIRDLVKRPTVSITYGKTQDNKENLSTIFIDLVQREYGGTRLGRQELEGQLLDDNPYALWKRKWIDANRLSNFLKTDPYGNKTKLPDMWKMGIGVDPAVSANEDSAETGIIGAGIAEAMPGMQRQEDPHFYIFDDVSMKGTPKEWSDAVVALYEKLEADKVIGEVNNGGDLVEANIPRPFLGVHASRGKAIRAEPVSTLYEQGRVHHIGSFPELEDQCCEWDPTTDVSPDRMDALVWIITWLKLGGGGMLQEPDFNARSLGL